MINLLFQRIILGTPLNTQSLHVYRSSGSFVKGKWVENPQSPLYFEIQGIAYPSTEKELDMVPEGDRIKGAITFISVEEIFVTNTSTPGTSDQIEWNGERYKIIAILPWKDYGYYMSIGERIKGA
jgi:hypothetical protein